MRFSFEWRRMVWSRGKGLALHPEACFIACLSHFQNWKNGTILSICDYQPQESTDPRFLTDFLEKVLGLFALWKPRRLQSSVLFFKHRKKALCVCMCMLIPLGFNCTGMLKRSNQENPKVRSEEGHFKFYMGHHHLEKLLSENNLL